MFSFCLHPVNRKIPTSIKRLDYSKHACAAPACRCISRKVRRYVLSPRIRGCKSRGSRCAGAQGGGFERASAGRFESILSGRIQSILVAGLRVESVAGLIGIRRPEHLAFEPVELVLQHLDGAASLDCSRAIHCSTLSEAASALLGVLNGAAGASGRLKKISALYP